MNPSSSSSLTIVSCTRDIGACEGGGSGNGGDLGFFMDG